MDAGGWSRKVRGLVLRVKGRCEFGSEETRDEGPHLGRTSEAAQLPLLGSESGHLHRHRIKQKERPSWAQDLGSWAEWGSGGAAVTPGQGADKKAP